MKAAPSLPQHSAYTSRRRSTCSSSSPVRTHCCGPTNHPTACALSPCRILPPLRNNSGLEEVIRFDGLFKGFTFRARRKKAQPLLLQALLALPFIKAIEPDQLFYPELASGV